MKLHYWEDCLPDDDPRCNDSLKCYACQGLVHAFNNETMQPWLDTPKGPVCLDCLVAIWHKFDFEFDLLNKP